MKHRFKTIEGAVRRVRQLEKIVDLYVRADAALLCERKATAKKLEMLARLSADGPAFMNPLTVYEAKSIRNEILAKHGMNPDGSFKKVGQ